MENWRDAEKSGAGRDGNAKAETVAGAMQTGAGVADWQWPEAKRVTTQRCAAAEASACNCSWSEGEALNKAARMSARARNAPKQILPNESNGSALPARMMGESLPHPIGASKKKLRFGGGNRGRGRLQL